MKIAYVYSTLAKTGGTERMITEKANYFVELLGYDVTIINSFQLPGETNHFHLSSKVKQINLGILYFSQYKYKYPQRLWIKWKVNRLLRRSINQAVRQVDPDILIGVVQFQANLVSSIRCRSKKVFECHEAKCYTLSYLGRKQPFPTKVYNKISRYFYFRSIEKTASAIVTLTKKDKLLWEKAKRVEVIPNFSTMPINQYSNCTHKRVIAVGRLEWEKGFERLIQAWNIISSRFPDWFLYIFGEGELYNDLIDLIKTYKTKNITIHPFSSNISQEYVNSSICAVTSYFEGFSLVILEAMKHGVPCIAFDCPFGPGEIIENNKCGYLIEDGNITRYAEKLSNLIENDELRKQFSEASIKRSYSFNKDTVMLQWKKLFEELVGE